MSSDASLQGRIHASGPTGGESGARGFNANQGSLAFDGSWVSAVAHVCRHYALTAQPRDIVMGLPLKGGDIYPEIFDLVGNRLGLIFAQLSPEQLHAALLSGPVIARTRSQGIVVLVSQEAGMARMLSVQSSGQLADIALDAISEDLADDALFSVLRTGLMAARPDDQEQLSGIWGWIRFIASQQRSDLRYIVASSLAVAVLSLAMPLFSRAVYDRVIPSLAIPTMVSLSIGVILALLFDLVIKLARHATVSQMLGKSDTALLAGYQATVLGSSAVRMAKTPTQISADFAELSRMRDLLNISMIASAFDFVVMLAALLAIFFIAPLAAILLLLVSGLVLALIWRGHQAYLRSMTVARSYEQKRHRLSIQYIFGLETIVSQGMIGAIQRRWSDLNQYCSETFTASSTISHSLAQQKQMAYSLIYIAMLGYGLVAIGNQALTMGGLIAITMLINRVIGPILSVPELKTKLAHATSLLGTLNENRRLASGHGHEWTAQTTMPIKALQLVNLTVQPADSDRPVLSDISLQIAVGEKLALIGSTGAGKSSLLRVMAGLLPETQGEVRINGALRDMAVAAKARRSIGYLSSDIALFDGSLRDNLFFAEGTFSDDLVADVLDVSGASRWLATLPAGLDTQIAGDGRALSAGQRQSLGIARALIQSPSLLLLDDPTNCMDGRAEAEFIAKIVDFASRRKAALVFATHRAALLGIADRVLVMEAGTIRSSGPRDLVLAQLAEARRASQAA